MYFWKVECVNLYNSLESAVLIPSLNTHSFKGRAKLVNMDRESFNCN